MDEEKKKTFAEQISSVLNGTFPKKDTLEVRGETTFILRQVGFKNLPMHTAQRHIKAALHGKDEKNPHWHGLSLDMLNELPNFFDNPVMIMDSISPNEDAKNSIVVVTDKFDSDGLPIIVSVQPDGEGRCNSIRLNSNFITSVYGKDRFANFINRNLEENSILYVDKEKSQALYRGLQLQLPQGLYNLDFDTIIRKSKAFVNREDEKKSKTTEKNEESMKADTNNATAQTARERVQQVRDEMVKTLLEHIENNPTKWQAGWNNIAAGAPYNGKTNSAYRGLNALYLTVLGMKRGYKDTRWVTFNQAKEIGASVKKGEKSAPVIFFEYYDRATKRAFDSRTVKDMTEEEKVAYLKENVYAVMKYSSVFNAEQCYNFPERKDVAMSEEERANQNVKIEAIIANSSAPVRYDGGSRAYYSPGTDSIHLPVIKAFDTMQDYYATALHEIAHSTGHESRLNRDLAGGFGSESYAKEEMRAELACVFMQMEQGIQLNGKHITNHAAYLNSWLEAAKKDTSVFFKAAADAQKIADYVADNYLQAADVAVTADENVAQEQSERNPMADYLRTAQPNSGAVIDSGERTWEQENIRDWYTSAYPNDEAGLDIHPNATFKDLSEEVNRPNPVTVYGMLGEDSVVRERAFTRLAELSGSSYASIYSAFLGETAQQKLENARALAKRLTTETGEPYVTIEWSEHRALKSYDVMSLSEADKELAALDAYEDRNEDYYKTKLHIDYVFEGKHNAYECCRFDIGSEGGGLVHHIDEFLKYDTFLGDEERQEAENALEYFKVHKDLSAMVDTAIASGLSEQEQFDVQSYVLAARGAVNSAIPFSTYKLPDMTEAEQQNTSEPAFRVNNLPSKNERANGYQRLAESKSLLGQEYARIKGENADSVVFYRVGDFYEVLGADAERVAEKLELTLTGRTVGTEDRIPMCGVPYHAIDQYADTLAKKGENVIVTDGTEIKAHKAKIDLTEKRLRDYADALRRNDLEVGNTAQTDEYYLNQAREQIAAYERSDEYKQTVREDFPKDFMDDGHQDMAEIPRNKAVEAQERKREWLSIELPDGAVGGKYGENTMIKMPKGEFSYYAFYVPTKMLKEADGKTQLRVASDYTFRLNNDGRQVELTGQELKDSFAGKHLDKTYKRVAPSRKYAQGLENLEKNVPAELKEIPTWCCYRTRWNEEKGKKDKFIISPIDGKWTSSKEPGRWVTFDAALKYARENNYEGISVLLDKKYGITCIDLDKCILNAETGEMKERATKLVGALNGTYIERSTSGNGLHIFVKDDILKNGTYNSQSMVKDEDPRGDLEVFDDKRIMSMTGDMYSKGNTLTRAGSAATVYLRQELGERRNVSSNGAKPRPSGSLNMSDNELIRWIRSSKAGAKFDDLYNGRGVSGDRSNDDGKLAHMLLYFNGGDKDQAFRIMRESGAYRPDKPDSYYRRTIDKMDEKIEVYAKHPTFSADGSGKPKGKGSWNGKKGSQA